MMTPTEKKMFHIGFWVDLVAVVVIVGYYGYKFCKERKKEKEVKTV
jgi:hypothetical protein